MFKYKSDQLNFLKLRYKETGKVFRVYRINAHAPPLVQASANSFDLNLAATFPRRRVSRVSFKSPMPSISLTIGQTQDVELA